MTKTDAKEPWWLYANGFKRTLPIFFLRLSMRFDDSSSSCSPSFTDERALT